MPTTGITQFYIEHQIKRSLPLVLFAPVTPPIINFGKLSVDFCQFNVVFSDKRAKGLLIAADYDDVHYIEILLEKFLKIQDRPISGECADISQLNSTYMNEAIFNKFGKL